MGLQRLAGIVLVAGSILFWLAALMPPVPQLFAARGTERKLAIILSARRGWAVSQIFFGLGSWVAALGIGLTAYHFRNIPGSVLGYSGFAALGIGAALWSCHVYLRTVDPKAFVEGLLPAWLFTIYTLLLHIGLFLFGNLLLRTVIPSWVGWVIILGAALFFIVYLVLRDLPPAINYTLTLFMGIILAVRG